MLCQSEHGQRGAAGRSGRAAQGSLFAEGIEVARTRRAFTLVELLVVIAIIGVLVGL
ncbi:MAG: type II secretion system protein, partial [Planctomycetales bacterium]|nr:type II secretion system protein [Planctomycetales bacterium]